MPSNEIETSESVVAVTMDHDHDDQEYDQTAQALIKKMGFDLDNINKLCVIDDPYDDGYTWSVTPMIYFCSTGNLPMCQYLFFRLGADCRQTDGCLCFPMLIAAAYGHLEIVRWLSQVGGAREDIRKVTKAGNSPLGEALRYGYFPVAQWFILNGAWAPHILWILGGSLHNCSKVIDDTLMRKELHPKRLRTVDQGRAILSWAKEAVKDHDNIYVFLTGTIVSAASYRRHPKNQYATRSKRMKVAPSSSSPVELLKGNVVLKLVAAYVETKPKPQDLRIYRHLMDRLPAFIDEQPFVVEEEDEEDA